MKTKSILFAALVTLTFATTSCQDESINPSIIDYRSGETMSSSTESKTLIDGNEALIEEQTTPNQEIKNTTKPVLNKSNNVPVNIMQIDSDEVK